MRIERALCNKTSSHAAMSTKRSDLKTCCDWERCWVEDANYIVVEGTAAKELERKSYVDAVCAVAAKKILP